jgi:hypothetical protein
MDNSPDEENQYLQQLQFCAHWFWDLLPLFSIHELACWEFRLIEAFCDLKPVDRRL